MGGEQRADGDGPGRDKGAGAVAGGAPKFSQDAGGEGEKQGRSPGPASRAARIGQHRPGGMSGWFLGFSPVSVTMTGKLTEGILASSRQKIPCPRKTRFWE